MIYKFANKQNYEHLAAGGVIRSYKGNTNFPVRLGHEIFNRCTEYINKKENIILYDPLCGSGYLLTTIALLNFDQISEVYGSDISFSSLVTANMNFKLLTKEGLQERKSEIDHHYKVYHRPSYRKALEHISQIEDIVKRDLSYDLFEQDLFSSNYEITFQPDIVIMDLPYDRLVNYQGEFSNFKLFKRIEAFIEEGIVLAVIYNKAQKTNIGLSRCERFVIGKRIVDIYGKKL